MVLLEADGSKRSLGLCLLIYLVNLVIRASHDSKQYWQPYSNIIISIIIIIIIGRIWRLEACFHKIETEQDHLRTSLST
jgi:hypothetical protein